MSDSPPLSRGWIVAVAAVTALVVLAVLPPVVGGQAGVVIRGAFAAVCHQLPDRSPHLAGEPLALCHRCWGILLGLTIGIAAVALAGARGVLRIIASRQGVWLVAAGLPTALDWLLGASDLWTNTGLSRVLTGAVFGLAAGALLGANLLWVRPSSPSLDSLPHAS